MPDPKFAIGDVVALKCGGTNMVIDAMGSSATNDEVRCVWQDADGHPHVHLYHEEVLVLDAKTAAVRKAEAEKAEKTAAEAAEKAAADAKAKAAADARAAASAAKAEAHDKVDAHAKVSKR